MKVIIRKYIQNTTEVYGYFAGATFANQIGLTTHMPAILEIITSKETTKGRNIGGIGEIISRGYFNNLS